jgi:hypothetical protein
MAKWWKFGFGKKDQGPEPEQTPAPAPEPTPQAPEPSAGAEGGEKKRGLLGRFFRRDKGKEKAPAPAPEAPPTAPPAPPTAPPTPPAAPASEAGEAGEGGEPAGPSGPERTFPSSIDVEADGDWRISSTEWSGHMQGTIRGHQARVFIEAFEKGQMNTCVQMVANAWDVNVGDQINPKESTSDYINWS